MGICFCNISNSFYLDLPPVTFLLVLGGIEEALDMWGSDWGKLSCETISLGLVGYIYVVHSHGIANSLSPPLSHVAEVFRNIPTAYTVLTHWTSRQSVQSEVKSQYECEKCVLWFLTWDTRGEKGFERYGARNQSVEKYSSHQMCKIICTDLISTNS